MGRRVLLWAAASCLSAGPIFGEQTTENLENHIAYLANWLQAMKNDPRFIFTASVQASKAADFILSFSRQTEEAVETDDELVTA